ncbi:MAG: glutathione S-transferase family protein [Cellvibrionaceae bacterium]
MYKLYSIPGTCSTGITVLLQELGQDVEIINPHDIEGYTSISPTNQVPALDDNGLILTEGAAIALYLLDKHGSDLRHDDSEKRGEFLRWLMFNYATLHPSYSKLFTVNGVMEGSSEKDALLTKLADLVSDNWAILDRRLEGREYTFGDTVTVIDYLICIYSGWNQFFPQLSINLGNNVRRLVDKVSELPEFQSAFALENNKFVKAS